MGTSAEVLCRLTQLAFREFTDSVMNAKFEEEPNYARYIAMFEPMVNIPERPLVVEAALKVIMAVATSSGSVLLSVTPGDEECHDVHVKRFCNVLS